MNKSKHVVNAIKFELAENQQKFSFYRKKRGRMAVLNKEEFPEKWVETYPKTAAELDVLYTDFTTGDEDADFLISVELEQAPKLTSRYIEHRLHHFFKNKADFRSVDFINRPVFWFRDRTADEFGYHAYKRFVLNVRKFWFTKGWGLLVIYQGYSYLYPKTMTGDDFNLPPELITKFTYNGYVLHDRMIPEEKRMEIDYSRARPFVNLEIRRREQNFSPPDPYHNRVAGYYNDIEWFRKRFLTGEELKKFMKAESAEWAEIPAESIYKLPSSAGRLRFGKGKTHVNPYFGMKDNGPWKTSPHKNIRILLVAHKDDVGDTGRRFYNCLRGHETFTLDNGARINSHSFRKFLNVRADLSGKFISYKHEEDPLPELLDKLETIKNEAAPDTCFFVFYITRIEKEEKDEDRSRVYYQLKEEFLKRDISSQVVEKSTIWKDDFNLSLPNIYAATLAKLDGVPWVLNEPLNHELIVGIGAYKPSGADGRYLGSAICFRNNGTFHGVRCFTEDEPHMLAGSMREAVHHYVSEQKGKPVQRLIIHFYKQMSRKEWEPIMETLQNTGLRIPVIVLTISKTEYTDTVLFDRNSRYKLPLSGTWMFRSKNDILLCNNTRYNQKSTIKKGFPFPVRIKAWCSDGELLYQKGVMNDLVKQVYGFSKLYWKSVSQQPTPVTIAYPEMVARCFPWFEGLTLPEFGRTNLWFL